MATTSMVQAYVEKLCAEMLGLDGSPDVDEDGSIPVRRGSAIYYVDVVDQGDKPHLVRVWSIVLRNPSGGRRPLLKALNSINSRILQAKVFLDEDNEVIMSTELLAETLTVTDLSNTCETIGELADLFDDELQAEFSGDKSFEDEDEDNEVTV